MDGTYTTLDGRPALIFERRLAHPVDKVWQAVTDPAQLKAWFPAEVAFDGDAMTFTFADGQAPPSSGSITEWDPPRVFAFTWEGDELRFELGETDGGCLLRFTSVLDERETAARNAAGWHVCLDRLADRLAGSDGPAPSGEPTGEWRALYDGYVADGVPSGAPVPNA